MIDIFADIVLHSIPSMNNPQQLNQFIRRKIPLNDFFVRHRDPIGVAKIILKARARAHSDERWMQQARKRCLARLQVKLEPLEPENREALEPDDSGSDTETEDIAGWEDIFGNIGFVDNLESVSGYMSDSCNIGPLMYHSPLE